MCQDCNLEKCSCNDDFVEIQSYDTSHVNSHVIDEFSTLIQYNDNYVGYDENTLDCTVPYSTKKV